MSDMEGRPERGSVVPRRRLDEETTKGGVPENPSIGNAVQRDSPREGQIREGSLRLQRTQLVQHDTLQTFLQGFREIPISIRDRIFRTSGGTERLLHLLPVKGSDPRRAPLVERVVKPLLGKPEPRRVEFESSFWKETNHVGESGREFVLSIRGQPHDLALVSTVGEAQELAHRRVQGPQGMGEERPPQNPEPAPLADGGHPGGKIAETVQRKNRRTIEPRNEIGRGSVGAMMLHPVDLRLEGTAREFLQESAEGGHAGPIRQTGTGHLSQAGNVSQGEPDLAGKVGKGVARHRHVGNVPDRDSRNAEALPDRLLREPAGVLDARQPLLGDSGQNPSALPLQQNAGGVGMERIQSQNNRHGGPPLYNTRRRPPFSGLIVNRPTRLYLLTQSAHPEITGAAHMTTDLAVGLSEQGIPVHVLTGQPSNCMIGDLRRLPKTAVYQGIPIRRFPHPRLSHRSVSGRLINSFATAWGALFFLLHRPARVPLLVDSTSPFLSWAAWLLHHLQHRRYFYLIHDLYPEIATELGFLKRGSWGERLWRFALRRVCRNAERIIILGDCMKRRFLDHYSPEIPEERVAVIRNWADGRLIHPSRFENNSFRKSLGLDDGLLLAYSGHLGHAHELESLLQALSRLEQSEPVSLLIIGQGPQREALEASARRLNLPKVRFLPYQTPETLPWTLTAADVSVVSIRAGLEGLLLPHKFYSSLAAGQAILAITRKNSDLARIVEEGDCGQRVDPGDPAAIAVFLRALLRSPEQLARYRANARNTFERTLTRDRALSQYAAVLRLERDQPSSMKSIIPRAITSQEK